MQEPKLKSQWHWHFMYHLFNDAVKDPECIMAMIMQHSCYAAGMHFPALDQQNVLGYLNP